MAKRRTPIPAGVAAAVLFSADRTCCVCRESGQPIQIHHIDDDPGNHAVSNLAVLCLTCHQETQVTGGFARRLDGDQVRLYRDDWDQSVRASRSAKLDDDSGRQSTGTYSARLATSLVEINRQAGNSVNLAFLYNSITNQELRDKAVNQALANGVSTDVLVMLRRLQGQVSDIPANVLDEHLQHLRAEGRFRARGALHADLGQHRKAAEAYVDGINSLLPDIEDFTLAYYLKELAGSDIITGLFVQALQTASDDDDLWWQVRALQELGWTTELHALLLNSKERIETDPDLGDVQRCELRLILARAKGDRAAEREARIALERHKAEITWT